MNTAAEALLGENKTIEALIQAVSCFLRLHALRSRIYALNVCSAWSESVSLVPRALRDVSPGEHRLSGVYASIERVEVDVGDTVGAAQVGGADPGRGANWRGRNVLAQGA